MKNTQCKNSFVMTLVIASCLPHIAFATMHNTLTCKVNGSDDYFVIYEDQLSYASDTFAHYQLIDGLTVIIINKQTMRFNRLSNLNLLPNSTNNPQKPTDKLQLFEGQCKTPI